ncbi:unnamed protein product [Camellia sinensis]
MSIRLGPPIFRYEPAGTVRTGRYGTYRPIFRTLLHLQPQHHHHLHLQTQVGPPPPQHQPPPRRSASSESTTPLATAPPSFLATKRQSSGGSGSNSDRWWWRWLTTVWVGLRVVCNTLVDVMMFMATALYLKDTRTPLKGPPGLEFTPRRFVYRTVSLDNMKVVKNAMNMTINDVALAITQAGLSRYLNRRYVDLFNKFGAVKDVFIPQKRRKVTNTRFGFMRYDCSIVADIAEQKANGLWVDSKSLSVKIVEYGKGIEDRQSQKPLPPRHSEPRKANALAPKQMWHQRTDGRSFTEVTKGVDPRCLSLTTIKVDELGNLWLYENMIMRLKVAYFVQQVKNELIKKWVNNVLVREGCGRDAIISFSSKEEIAVDVALASKVALGDLASQMMVRAELADGGNLSHVSAVDETKDCAGISNEEGTGVVESSLPADSLLQRQCNHDTQKDVEAQ